MLHLIQVLKSLAYFYPQNAAEHCNQRLNMELDLQSLFGLHVT
jgi:hypothetical protein